MPRIHIAVLWHMHQPNYRDPIKGYYSMPWVRLHATKAYYDMAVLAGRYPEMRLTFNLVPALLEQLEDYERGAEDFELILSRRDPAALQDDEKEAILSRFFQANHDTMIRPLPRYLELLQSRGEAGTLSDIKQAVRKFSAQDFLDLQVLFNLSWFGFSARQEDEDIRRLIRRGRYYTIEDRDLVLERQHGILTKLIPLYRSLWDQGAVDLTTTPFYHPIMPLLCDTTVACAGMPDCRLPVHVFRHPEDAERQVEMGLEYMKQRFGRRPDGMWPSEGSVSPRTLEILAEAGVKWSATDEGVLERSIPSFSKETHLYRPWNAHGVAMFFRDLRLSDQIGFVYSRNPAETAVTDFISRLREIPGRGDRIVSIILDGENAWEFYPESGREFLSKLYERIIAEPDFTPVNFSAYLAEHPPKDTIDSIFPGSWINADFGTWMGDQEEIDGWDALAVARDLLAEREHELDEAARTEAWLEIYRAEGSDWFWWYGDDHSSPNDPEFDRLFRAHLERVYRLLGMEPPQAVREPIIRKQPVQVNAEPTGLIAPAIDGRQTTFYEWLNAGWLPAIGPEGAMSGGEAIIADVYYGFDLTSLYLRIDPVKREEPVDLGLFQLAVEIHNGEEFRIEVDLARPRDYLLYHRAGGRWVRRTRRASVALEKIIELCVEFGDLSMKPGDKGFFTVAVLDRSGIERERVPRTGKITFVVPDKYYQSRMWQL